MTLETLPLIYCQSGPQSGPQDLDLPLHRRVTVGDHVTVWGHVCVITADKLGCMLLSCGFPTCMVIWFISSIIFTVFLYWSNDIILLTLWPHSASARKHKQQLSLTNIYKHAVTKVKIKWSNTIILTSSHLGSWFLKKIDYWLITAQCVGVLKFVIHTFFYIFNKWD